MRITGADLAGGGYLGHLRNAVDLPDRHQRACAKLAMMARIDARVGGARALVYGKRLKGMRSQVPVDEIISDEYSGRGASKWTVTACPECGTAHLGYAAAAECCSNESE